MIRQCCRYGLLLFALLALAGCERQAVVRDYFPMRVSNRWEYRLLDGPRLRALEQGEKVPTLDTVVGEEHLDPVAVRTQVRAEVIDVGAADLGVDEQPQQAEKSDDEGAESAIDARPARRIALELKEEIELLTYRAEYGGGEQIWSKRSGYVGFQSGRGRHYLLILPPHSGYRWTATATSEGNQYFEIEGYGSIETPHGIFRDCVISRQESRDRRIVHRYWFAPDVGLVRRSKYYLGQEVFRQELMSYKVRPAKAEARSAESDEIVKAMRGKRRGQEFNKEEKKTELDPLRELE